MSAPAVVTFRVPAGDSKRLEVPITDQATGEAVDLDALYDAAEVGIARAPLTPSDDPPALVTKTKAAGQVQFLPGGVLACTLTPADTGAVLGPGRYRVQVRCANGATVRETMEPMHVLIVTASPLG